MRFDFLEQDTIYFRDHFPTENYDIFGLGTLFEDPERLETYLGKGWESGSNIKLNFFEALAWLRSDDYIKYNGLKSYAINDYDTEFTYDTAEYQEWCSDEDGRFCADRHASAIYNLPIRIVNKLNMMAVDKNRQAEYVLEFIRNHKDAK
jgi:hypothetical protein